MKIKRLTEQERKEIIEKYVSGKYSFGQLAKEYKCASESISYHLKKANVTKIDRSRKYHFNEHYFDVIDTENKAYFLGLIFSDGNNSENRMSLGLQEEDKYILEAFAQAIGYEGKLSFIQKSKPDNNLKNMYYLRLSSKILCDKLSELGCIPRKSLLLKFPKCVPDSLLHHFLRGYFDGDGSISFRKKDMRPAINVVGTKEFLYKFKAICNKNGIKFSKPYRHNKNNKNTYSICIGGLKKTENYHNFLYKNANVYLIRKHNKFIEANNEATRQERFKS